MTLLSERDELAAALDEQAGQGDQAPHGPTQPVEPPHHEPVALPQEGERGA